MIDRRKILRMGLAAVLGTSIAGLTSCDQSTQGGDKVLPEETGLEATGFGPRAIGEGQKLEGEALKAFLAANPGAENPEVKANLSPQPSSLAKQTAQACLIDFNNYSALAQLPDKASSWYTLYPWYKQTCGSHIAGVAPVGRNYYYLTTEAAGTCTHSAGYIGYGALAGSYYCKNQKDAALFPRRAGNGSTTDKTLGLEVTVQAGGYWKNFDINNLKVLEGPVVVYGWRSGQGWWWWGPLGAGDWYWTNGQNVSQMRIHSWNNAGTYVIDDIRITGY